MSDLAHMGATESAPDHGLEIDWLNEWLDRQGVRICLVCGQPFRGDEDVCGGCDLLTIPFSDALDYESDALLWDEY